MLAFVAGGRGEDLLAAALEGGKIASIVLSSGVGEPMTAASAGSMVALGQKAGVAMLLEGEAELARTLRADGVHLTVGDKPREALEAARAWLGGRSILGADAGRSRDDAMELGEHGADYVAFGIPSFVKGREEARERQRKLVEWWAEIFEVPVVAMSVEDPEAVYDLVIAGADFVCLSVPHDATADEVRGLVDAARSALQEANAHVAEANAGEE